MRVAVVDPIELRALVKGKTAAEAKAALQPYGDATVTLWPSWVSTVTGVDARLSITVASQAGSAGSGASASATAIPATGPGRSPGGSPPIHPSPSAGSVAP